MKSPKKNVAESVRARLLTLSKKRGDEFHLTLADYVIERFDSRHYVTGSF